MLLGDIFILISILLWMGIVVGPIWLALLIFSIGSLLNYWISKLVHNKIEKARQEHLKRMTNFINSYKKENIPEE